jgi:hypothetical protein
MPKGCAIYVMLFCRIKNILQSRKQGKKDGKRKINFIGEFIKEKRAIYQNQDGKKNEKKRKIPKD